MTLIIAVRCRNGAGIIADRRSRIVRNGEISYDDSYGKFLRTADGLVYNHGYNRIRDRDWKLSANDLALDEHHPVYAMIAREMTQKQNRTAGYVFLNPGWIEEISIDAGQIPKRTRFADNHDRLLSGDGKPYVDLSPFTDLQRKTIAETTPMLESVFLAAHARLIEDNGDLFSESYDLETIEG